ncbi:MAG: hypothetical protein II821_06810 [Treponema sp.]|nr:hypothetical protein [Treponema sp.]
MKKVLLNVFVAVSAAFLLVSCGEKSKTPDEQFKSVVSTSVMDTTKKVASGVNEAFSQIDFSNYGADSTISISLDKNSADLIRGIFTSAVPGVKIDWLNSMQLSTKASIKDKSMAFSLGLGVNEVNIITLECLEDLENAVIYFHVPELLKEHFKLDAAQAGGASVKELLKIYLAEFEFLKAAPKKEVFTGFVEELLNAVLTDVSGVERSTENVKAGLNSSKTVAVDYTALDFKITPEYAKKASENIEKTINSSKNLRTIVEWVLTFATAVDPSTSSTSADEIISSIAEGLAEGVDSLADIENTVITVYADSKSNFRGAKLTAGDDGYAQYIFALNGKEFGYNVSATEKYGSSESEIFSVKGYGSYAGGKTTGDFAVFSEEEELFSFSTDNLDVEGLKNLKCNGSVTVRLTDDVRKQLKRELRYSVDSSVLSLIDNIAFTLDMNQKSLKEAETTLSIGDGDKTKYASLKVNAKIRAADKVKVPADAVDVLTLNENDALEYVKKIETQNVIDSLKKAKVDEEYVELLSQFSGESLAQMLQGYGL